jgi:phage repressor protein C with HTH and peptisase S24 domain
MNHDSNINAKWPHRFEIVKNKIFQILGDEANLSQRSIADFLGTYQSKVRLWSGGQLPSANDLESIARKCGISPTWLLTGEGQPEGRTIPDDAPRADWAAQYPVIMKAWKKFAADNQLPMSELQFAKEAGITHGKHQAWKKGQRPSSDDLEKLASVFGLHPDWLLLGMGDPRTGMDGKKTAPQKLELPQAAQHLTAYQQELPPVPPLQAAMGAGRLPVTGLAPCGVQGWETGRRMAVDVDRLAGLGPRAFAALPVGDSMLPEGIREGMVCYCDPDRAPDHGDAVYVEADGKATIKLWLGDSPDRKGMVRLQGWLPKRNGAGVFHLDVDRKSVTVIAPVVYVKRRA